MGVGEMGGKVKQVTEKPTHVETHRLAVSPLPFIAEGILPLSVCPRGCFPSLGFRRVDTATVCMSEGMLSLSRFQQRGYCHSLSVVSS